GDVSALLPLAPIARLLATFRTYTRRMLRECVGSPQLSGRRSVRRSVRRQRLFGLLVQEPPASGAVKAAGRALGTELRRWQIREHRRPASRGALVGVRRALAGRRCTQLGSAFLPPRAAALGCPLREQPSG